MICETLVRLGRRSREKMRELLKLSNWELMRLAAKKLKELGTDERRLDSPSAEIVGLVMALELRGDPAADPEGVPTEILERVMALDDESRRLKEVAMGCGLAISHGMACPLLNEVEDGVD